MKDQILELRSAGYTYSQIVEELGCAKSTVAYYCGEGVKTKHISRRRDKRNNMRKYLMEYKQSRGCSDCGESYPYYMLDFDHLEDKKHNLSALGQFNSLDELKDEVAKCEVVCANCHRIRTYNRLLKTGWSTMELSEFYP